MIDRKDRRLVVRLLSGETELMLLLEQQNTLIEPSSLRSLGLTARENEVLAGMANGHTKAEIAHALAISPRTIDAHVQKIYDRLGVTTLNAAAARAFQATRLAAARSG
ncbi:MAG TPA: helix-turn-helix transcriptional regulator [Patescibacteria group bacterium]|nr:helix-turn-helix transcriptional regulator [Patescibacteria group bacterium]